MSEAVLLYEEELFVLTEIQIRAAVCWFLI
jgi:hypothetical protein